MESAGKRSYKRIRKVAAKPRNARARISAPPMAVQRYLSARGTPNGIHEFRRSVRIRVQCFNDGISIGAARGNGWSLVFTTSSMTLTNSAGGFITQALPNAAELAALFDMIKIDKVECTLQATNQSGDIGVNPASVANTGQAILVQTCIDFNSSTNTPATEGAVQEYGNYQQKMLDSGKTLVRTFSPKYSVTVADTAGAVTSAEARTGYLRSGTDFTHSGLYGWAIGPTVGTALEFCVTYCLKCKNTK